MFQWLRIPGSALVALALLSSARAADNPPVEKDQLGRVQEATGQLIRELENLQQDIIGEMAGQKDRVLYRQSDAVLGQIVQFQAALKVGVSRAVLDKFYGEMDKPLHDLLDALLKEGPKSAALERAAYRISAADEELVYAIAGSERTEPLTKRLLRRQAAALVATTRELERTAQYVLGATAGREALVGDLKKLVAAAELFQKGLELASNPEQMQKSFAPVNQAWERVVLGLQQLPPAEHIYLLRSAGRADRIHEHLHGLLNVPGKRPGLTLRAALEPGPTPERAPRVVP